MSTKTRFEKEAKGNSEMVYCPYCRDCYNWKKNIIALWAAKPKPERDEVYTI